MQDIAFKNVSLKEMIEDLAKSVTDENYIPKKYLWCNGSSFVGITSVDLLRDRFQTKDDDFSCFEWELKNSKIYIKE